MKFNIIHQDGHIIWSHDVEDNSLLITLKEAGSYGINLSGANLSRKKLRGIYLDRANLSGADLSKSNLTLALISWSNMSWANLTGANLRGANLYRTNLTGANLTSVNFVGVDMVGTNFDGAIIKDDCKLIGERPIINIGPIRPRYEYLTAYITDKGVRVDDGYNRQIPRDEFEAQLSKRYMDNTHAKEYRAALSLIDIHEGIWGHK